MHAVLYTQGISVASAVIASVLWNLRSPKRHRLYSRPKH